MNYWLQMQVLEENNSRHAKQGEAPTTSVTSSKSRIWNFLAKVKPHMDRFFWLKSKMPFIPVYILQILPYTSRHESSWHKEHFEAILQILSTYCTHWMKFLCTQLNKSKMSMKEVRKIYFLQISRFQPGFTLNSLGYCKLTKVWWAVIRPTITCRRDSSEWQDWSILTLLRDKTGAFWHPGSPEIACLTVQVS